MIEEKKERRSPILKAQYTRWVLKKKYQKMTKFTQFCIAFKYAQFLRLRIHEFKFQINV